jgi:hypothetical protein
MKQHELKPSRKARRLMREYGNAARADEMKGGGDPASIPEIEHELERARRALETYLLQLEAYDSRGPRK